MPQLQPPSAVCRQLQRILNPRSVAVIGASENASKYGGRIMRHLLRHRFEGRIIPVNPAGGRILGLEAHASIDAAAGPIDVALLAVPRSQIAPAIEACGRAAVAGCVILSADFAEIGEEGAARERELVRTARTYGMRLIGPNCLGYINPRLHLAMTSSIALAPEPMPSGAIGLVSQSGSLMASLISHASDAGSGFSAAVSVGNQADLEVCDFIEYFLADDATRAICVYAEGFKDGQRFLALADECRSAGKPLLVVKAGSSEAGKKIAVSHTASLAGSHAVWEAACREHAVVLLDDPEALIQCADFLIRYGVPQGDGVAALSNSGGTIAVTADRLSAAGLRLAQLSPHTQRALHEIVPLSRVVNPLDVGGLAGDDGARRCFELLADDSDTAALLVVVATTPEITRKTRALGETALARRKPTALLFTPASLVDPARRALRELGCPFVNRMDDALRLLKAAIDYGRALRASRIPPILPAGLEAVDTFDVAAAQLTETEAKNLLRLAGIAVTADRTVCSADEAVRAAVETGYPVVLKLGSRTLTHKSEIGGVKLSLRDSEAVKSAWRNIEENVRRAAPGHAIECVVQPMVSGGLELIVGSHWDPQFGAIVMVGAGGIWVEALADTQLALVPVARERALELVAALRIWPVLSGGRGQARADIDALTDAIVRVSWLAARLGPRLVELDINPLLVKPAGQGAIALDARATLRADA